MNGNDAVLCSIEHDVATITLNRPDRGNGWTAATSRLYFPMFDALARDPGVRAIILTGAGSAFCVGGDSEKLDAVAGSSKPASMSNEDYWAPARIGKPVIAAINGACFGVGLQQALCCDMRMASHDAKFSTAYARRGLVAEFGMSWLLPRIVGVGHAMDLLLSARLVRAPEAERIGLVNRTVAASDLMATAMAYARELAERCSPGAMRAIKQQVYSDLMSGIDDAYARSEAGLIAAMAGADFREGVKSWREQRPPRFPPLAPDQAWLSL